jgi:hypothetical protein
MTETSVPTTRRGAEIDKLLERLEASPTAAISHSRPIFALDATASRQPAWDQACHVQGAMFEATASINQLDTQLVYYRGYSECRASRWVSTAGELHQFMRSVSCIGGHTQIARVLDHTVTETKRQQVSALVFVRRLNASSTTARYRKPAIVGTYVMSATQSWLGRSAVKFRSTRSGAGRASRSRRVVMTPRRRLTPTMPAARISRAIRFLPTALPSARNSA